MKKKLFVFVILLATKCSIAQWSPNGTSVYYNSGNVGIGITTPQYPLHLVVQGNTGTVSSVFHGQYYGTLISTENTGSRYYALDVRTGSSTSSGGVSGGISRFYIRGDGNVGIGTTNPQSKMYMVTSGVGNTLGDRINILSTETNVGNNTSMINLYSYRNVNGTDWLSASTRLQQRIDGTDMGFLEFNPPGMPWGLALGTNNSGRLYIDNNGNVGIGTLNINDNSFALFVEKGIRTRRVKVDQTGWPDYVFHPTYKLPSLKDLENYIKQNNHLPDVPSENEVENGGLDLGENQALLLKKIEELTLYIIDQDNKMQKQEKELQDMKKQLEAIKSQLKTN